MTKVRVRELVWDKYNLEHIKKHNVTSGECEQVSKDFIYHRKAKGGRYLAIGRTSSRILSIVIERKGQGKYYLVTARDASKKERRDLYEKEKK